MNKLSIAKKIGIGTLIIGVAGVIIHNIIKDIQFEDDFYDYEDSCDEIDDEKEIHSEIEETENTNNNIENSNLNNEKLEDIKNKYIEEINKLANDAKKDIKKIAESKELKNEFERCINILKRTADEIKHKD